MNDNEKNPKTTDHHGNSMAKGVISFLFPISPQHSRKFHDILVDVFPMVC